MPNFEILDWDSNFFGCKVARLPKNALEYNTYNILQELRHEKVVLAYYYTD